MIPPRPRWRFHPTSCPCGGTGLIYTGRPFLPGALEWRECRGPEERPASLVFASAKQPHPLCDPARHAEDDGFVTAHPRVWPAREISR